MGKDPTYTTSFPMLFPGWGQICFRVVNIVVEAFPKRTERSAF
jgi:hypothetical protein